MLGSPAGYGYQWWALAHRRPPRRLFGGRRLGQCIYVNPTEQVVAAIK